MNASVSSQSKRRGENYTVRYSRGLTILTGKDCVLLYSAQEWLYLAVSVLFYMFTQSIKFYTFHYHVLNSTDV